MEGFIFVVIFFVAFFVIAVRVAMVNAEKTKRAWSTAARDLGIDFTPAGVFAQQRMDGTLPTGQVTIETFRRGSGKHSHTYTRYRAFYRAPLELGLRLTQEGFFSGLGRLLGAQDIEMGDPDFDQQVVVKGGYPVEIAGFLTPTRRLYIRRAFASFPGLTLDDREIRWETRGVHRDPEEIVSTARRLSQLAWELSGRREEGQQVEESAGSERQGEIEEGLEAHAVEREEMPHVAEGEEDVPGALQRFLTNAPDEEIIRWAERVAGIDTPGEGLPVREEPSSPPPPLPAGPPPMPVSEGLTEPPPMPISEELPEPPVSPPVEPPAPEEPEAAPEVVSAPPPPLDQASICGELFAHGRSSLDASRILEERYQGKRVDWSGVLKSVESYSFDWIFGNDPGTKATLEIYEVPSDVYSHNKVQAVLQLGAGEDSHLRDSVGKTFSFQGTLLRADGLMRNLYLKDGSLSPSGAR